ncbi:carboxylesterase [Anaerobranca californiensis DSM 14826]|uniref:Carboxylesterase n=1 Tax=Anaerobranca californiensis DSM 14826 TaxID=1120989 RepID=A0A1M6QP57_9FIRM|nr:alpha/beta fold hydrolase [Anaerobranca californiensis]SHK22072.1 carboxylesterase [Anaerobranca californiensis DSM 14826]
MIITKKKADPFEYHNNGDVGVLLIHGFTGSPTEMAPLGEFLYKEGYSVYCPLLAGHGTDEEEMEKTTWKDWVASAEEGLKKLQGKYPKVFVIGFSMGGCIALYLGMKYNIAGIVSISAPIYLTEKKAYLTPVLKYFQRYKPKPKKLDYGVQLFSYDKTPIKCVSSLLKLILIVKYSLKKVKIPTLIIQGEDDRVVEAKSARYIFEKINSPYKELKYFPKRSHMIPVEQGREEVMDKVLEFLQRI